MSSIFVLDQTANVIDQTINTAYSGLVLAGTGLVRTTGDQNISGKKTFHGAVDFTGSAINFTGVSSFIPFSNASIDVGSNSRMFRTGFFSGVSGRTGYFQNLTVANLITSLVPSLVSVTGSGMTLSGTTNIVNANVSGNLGVTGNLLVRGTTILSGDISFLGGVLSTGNKTFSGVLNQSGNVNVYGQTFISGNSSFTGNVNITGNLFLQGNQNITGGFTHTGQHFINSNNSNIIFTGDGPNHAITLYAPTYLNGTIYQSGGNFFRSGNSISTGNISNSGSFENIGAFNLRGNIAVNVGSSVNFNTHPKFNSGVSCSGNSITPSLKIDPNLVSTPSGGAIEYSRGQFFATNELIGTPTRALFNQTYSYIAPQNFYTGIPTANVVTPLLGNTGIYLNTGRYNIKYDIKFSKTLAEPISLGVIGDDSNISDRIGYLISNSTTTAAVKTGFFGTNSTDNILTSGADLVINGFNFYSFDATITVTDLIKIRPVFRIPTAELITGSAFSMQVTQLATGTGVGLVGSNGPWSDS
jgi:hypothetical protein